MSNIYRIQHLTTDTDTGRVVAIGHETYEFRKDAVTWLLLNDYLPMPDSRMYKSIRNGDFAEIVLETTESSEFLQ